jgi:hypothetical protein
MMAKRLSARAYAFNLRSMHRLGPGKDANGMLPALP